MTHTLGAWRSYDPLAADSPDAPVASAADPGSSDAGRGTARRRGRRCALAVAALVGGLLPVLPGTATGAPVDAATDAGYTAAALRTTGYWILQSDGRVYEFGAAQALGNAPDRDADAVKIAPAANGAQGFFVLYADGAVEARGAATKRAASRPAGPATDAVGLLEPGERAAALSVTPSGNGYWIFTDRGRVFAYGDAQFRGDVAQLGLQLNGPILDSVAYADGSGYYMVGSDGGVFSFPTGAGAPNTFFGSMGGKPLNEPVQSLVPYPDGNGYWLVASDGGIFSFNRPGFPNLFQGAMPPGNALSGLPPGGVLQQPVVGMVALAGGYAMVARDGGAFIFPLRNGPRFFGSVYDKIGGPAPQPVTGIAALTQDDGTGGGTGGGTTVPPTTAAPTTAPSSSVPPSTAPPSTVPPSTTTTVAPTTTTTVFAPYLPNTPLSFGPGTYTVGTNRLAGQIPPGFYRQRQAPAGGVSAARCSIVKTTTDLGVVDTPSHGPQIVDVREGSDITVTIGSNCAPLVNDLRALGTVAGDYVPDFTSTAPVTPSNAVAGMFFTRSAVRGATYTTGSSNGVDVAPGTFTAVTGSAPRCYWARKSGFAGLEFPPPAGEDIEKNTILFGVAPAPAPPALFNPVTDQVLTFVVQGTDLGIDLDFRLTTDPNAQGIPALELGPCRFRRT